MSEKNDGLGKRCFAMVVSRVFRNITGQLGNL